MNFLNKIFKLHILFFVFSHIIYSMENRTFSVLLKRFMAIDFAEPDNVETFR